MIDIELSDSDTLQGAVCNSRSFVVVLLTLGFWAFAVVFVPVVTGPTRLTEGLMTESSMVLSRTRS